jgi:aspartyl-tRNA(Asn)/glutamyl-tRNA(Gln) amidotransferase subunit A
MQARPDMAGEVNGIFLARPERVDEGIPLAVKDLFDTAGLTTTYGSAIFADHVPDTDAEVVRRLTAAGYANVGKTNLHEFAYGITSVNPHFGTVPNPRAPGRIAGGSSGGSAAALAAGLADAALGTDSGGSIRIPAACCGVVGFKPSYDSVSLEGCFPLAPSFDHAGPMARSVTDCTAMMRLLADDFSPTVLASLDDLAVGVAWLELAEPLVREHVAAATSVFTRAREVAFPLPEGVDPAFMREVAQVHAELFAENPDLYGDNVRTKIELCLAVTDSEYEAGRRAREEYREQCEEAFAGLDLLITPTISCPPPSLPADDLEHRKNLIRFTFPFNALGWPVLALPCGPENELPVSLQLVGRDDAVVLVAGELLEASLERGNPF